jgi:hypothetical protein
MYAHKPYISPYDKTPWTRRALNARLLCGKLCSAVYGMIYVFIRYETIHCTKGGRSTCSGRSPATTDPDRGQGLQFYEELRSITEKGSNIIAGPNAARQATPSDVYASDRYDASQKLGEEVHARDDAGLLLRRRIGVTSSAHRPHNIADMYRQIIAKLRAWQRRA